MQLELDFATPIVKVPKPSWCQDDPVIGGVEMGTGSTEKLGLMLLLLLGKPVITKGKAADISPLGVASSDKLSQSNHLDFLLTEMVL